MGGRRVLVPLFLACCHEYFLNKLKHPVRKVRERLQANGMLLPT